MARKYGIVVVIAILFGLVFLRQIHLRSEMKFSSEIWKESAVDSPAMTARTKMLKDLVMNELRLGMSKSEVENLIGIGIPTKKKGYVCYDAGLRRFEAERDVLHVGYSDDNNLILISCHYRFVKLDVTEPKD